MLSIEHLDSNLVIYIISSFAIGFFSMLIYNNLKLLHHNSISSKNDNIIEDIISKNSYKLRILETKIAELHTRIDTIESDISQQYISRPSIFRNSDRNFYMDNLTSQRQSLSPERIPSSYVSKSITAIMHQPQANIELTTIHNTPEIENGTTDYILKLLMERPRTSREIQHTIRRTREHTSRLMKRLYEMNLVNRESNSKPFKYTIAEAGRIQLNAHQPRNHNAHGIEGDSNYSDRSSSFE
jgi:TolA-binding protein